MTLVPGSAGMAESLSAWCRENVAGYKGPEIRVVDALPMTGTGKVKRSASLV